MTNYEMLGCTELTNNNTNNPEYYFPHTNLCSRSPVLQPSWELFDALVKTSTSLSLNNMLMAGPTIQCNLISIMMRFHMHVYVMSAEIEYMCSKYGYGSIYLIKITWRDNDKSDLQILKTKKVTYCTTCAPYQNTEPTYWWWIFIPRSSLVVLNDLYVNDLLRQPIWICYG